VAEIAAARVLLGIPIVGQLELGALVARCGEKDQRVAALLVVVAPQLLEAELVHVEVQRLLDIADPDHRVQILHRGLPMTAPPKARFRYRGAWAWRRPGRRLYVVDGWFRRNPAHRRH